METSAKDGNNVNKLFCEAGKILYNDYEHAKPQGMYNCTSARAFL